MDKFTRIKHKALSLPELHGVLVIIALPNLMPLTSKAKGVGWGDEAQQ